MAKSKTQLRAQTMNSVGFGFDSIIHFLVTLCQSLYIPKSQSPPLQKETNTTALKVCEDSVRSVI